MTETLLRPAAPADLPTIFRAERDYITAGVHQGNPARALYEQEGYKSAGRDGEYLLYDFLPDEA